MAKQAKLVPIGGNILVKPLSENTVSAAGIVLPDTVDKEKPQKGEVVALGSGKVNSDGKKLRNTSATIIIIIHFLKFIVRFYSLCP